MALQSRSSKSNRKVRPVNPKGKLERNNQNDVFRLIQQPAFAQEQVKKFILPGPSQLVTTVGTTFAVVYAIGNLSTQATDFTDLSNMFDQYVILGADVSIQCLTPPTPGMAFWNFNSSANATIPVAVDESRDGTQLTNHSMNANKQWSMSFSVKDPFLLAYRTTGIDYVVGYFKGFTNLANFGTSALNTLLYRFRVKYHVVFRGRKV